MLSIWQTILCAVLLAGGAFSADEAIEHALKEGSSFTAYVMTMLDEVTSCYLVPPTGNDIQLIPQDESAANEKYELREPNSLMGCSVEVKDLREEDSGVWVLHTVSKEGLARSQSYRVTVEPNSVLGNADDSAEQAMTHLVWKRGDAVDKLLVVGSAAAVYCRVVDPTGLTTEGVGECRLQVDEVADWHAGVWQLLVWTTGKIVPAQWEVIVTLAETEAKPAVSTHFESQDGNLVMWCSVPIEGVEECTFLSPAGVELRLAPGASDGRYAYYDAGHSVESGVGHCGVSVGAPQPEDLGVWRCALGAGGQKHYGFVAATAAGDLELKDTEPAARALRAVVPAAAGSRPELSCSASGALRYCYFTAARNGTVYNVWPGSADYVGSGFEAGECGVRLPPVRRDDLDAWRCHLALVDPLQPELTASITLQVTGEDTMSVRLLWNGHWTPLQVEGHVVGRTLEYCRFVRMDGIGFTVDNAPPGYLVSRDSQADGRCVMVVVQPSTLDLHPWTVVAKAQGQDAEVSAVTRNLVNATSNLYSAYVTLWVIIILTTLSIFLVGMLVGPKKNREWTYRQASNVRQSFRRSFRKPPPGGQNTAPVA